MSQRTGSRCNHFTEKKQDISHICHFQPIAGDNSGFNKHLCIMLLFIFLLQTIAYE